MSYKIHAVISEMNDAARTLDKVTEEFADAVSRTKQAASRLTDGWEGDARNAFVEEQEEAFAYYQLVNEKAKEHAELLRKAAKIYKETDEQAARILQDV